MGIIPLKKRVNRDKCSFTTKQRMFGVMVEMIIMVELVIMVERVIMFEMVVMAIMVAMDNMVVMVMIITVVLVVVSFSKGNFPTLECLRRVLAVSQRVSA